MTHIGPLVRHPDLGPIHRVYADADAELRDFVRRSGLPGDIDGSGILPHLLISHANYTWTWERGAVPHDAWQYLVWQRPNARKLSKLDYAQMRILRRTDGHSLARAPGLPHVPVRQRVPVEAAQYCELCQGCDGNLPTHCPRTPITPAKRIAIYEGLIDFREDVWVPLPTIHMALIHGFKD